ncbi:MAG: hypothetical protein AB7Q04_13320 [Steroidobacteraceae bacterium]
MNKSVTVAFLAIVIVVGFYTGAYVILSGKVTSTDPNQLMLINTTLNYMNGLAMMAVGYYFGSSKGSSDKDKIISNMSGKDG